jgi:hypothetical protein
MSRRERESQRDTDTHRQRIVTDMSDTELREELVVAAMARGERRIDRFRILLRERDRRRTAHR